jgi:D-sedoheptulose 7-phosphate isomerase
MNLECLRWIEEAREALNGFDSSQLDKVVRLCATSLKSGGTIFFCGNGGSAADSQHLAAEFTGRFRSDRKALSAVSLSDNPASITAIANDYGYDQVFSRQLEALAGKGDVLVAESTSGASPNILKAVQTARAIGMSVIALTGRKGTAFAESADASILVPSEVSGHVQEVLMAAGHALCAAIEATLAERAR